MATLSELNGLIEEENRSLDSEKKPRVSPPSPSGFFGGVYGGLKEAPGAFVRGLHRSPATVLGMTPQGQNRGPYTQGMTLDQYKSQPTQAEVMDQLAIARSGVAEPQHMIGRTAERLGQTAPLAAASGLGMSTAVETPMAFLRNSVIGDVLAAMSEQGSADLGGGPGVQLDRKSVV